MIGEHLPLPPLLKTIGPIFASVVVNITSHPTRNTVEGEINILFILIVLTILLTVFIFCIRRQRINPDTIDLESFSDVETSSL